MVRSFNSRPDGKNDRQGRWYPDPETEECGCCKNIRRPSRSYPSSLWKHCTSKAHYLNLCAKLGEEPVDLPVKVRRKVEEMIGYKAVFISNLDDDKFFSIFKVINDGDFEWKPGEWRREKVDSDSMFHGESPASGLWYFGEIIDALMFARKNLDCADNFAIFECRCRFFQKYPSTNYRSKYICSMLKMEKEIYRAKVDDIFFQDLEKVTEKIKEALANG